MAKAPLPVVGWRELVHLPDLGLHKLPAKIDTGARTSSLHATVLDEYERDGEQCRGGAALACPHFGRRVFQRLI